MYIREAHPADEPGNEPRSDRRPPHGGGRGAVDQPKDEAERHEVAAKAVKYLKLTLPTLVDTMDDQVSRDYGGWPDRMYIVGLDGTVAYAGGPGPRGFDPDAVEAALKTMLE